LREKADRMPAGAAGFALLLCIADPHFRFPVLCTLG